MTATTMPKKLANLLATLEMMPDRADRIQLLIDIAKRFREVPPEVATRPFSDEHKVPACESEAFLWATPREDGSIQFHFAVENPQGISAKAMAVILDESLSGELPETIVQGLPGDLPHQIFGRELSMGKSMGLMGMVSMVQNSAKKLAAS